MAGNNPTFLIYHVLQAKLFKLHGGKRKPA